MFGRATITLGIGPHSSFSLVLGQISLISVTTLNQLIHSTKLVCTNLSDSVYAAINTLLTALCSL